MSHDDTPEWNDAINFYNNQIRDDKVKREVGALYGALWSTRPADVHSCSPEDAALLWKAIERFVDLKPYNPMMIAADEYDEAMKAEEIIGLL